MFNYNYIFDKLNIEKGDTLFCSSDFQNLYRFILKNYHEKINFDLIIDILKDKVGSNGNLIFPTYNWDFCKGITFDYKNTVSKVGAITNYILKKRDDFKRTKHPIYSFAVYGKDTDYLTNLDYKDSFAENGMFGFLYKKEAKQLFLNVVLSHSATFSHYAEQKVGVPYRFIKEFTAGYIDENGEYSNRTYSMYVRNYNYNVQTLVDPFLEDFIQNKCIQIIKNEIGNIWLLDYKKGCDIMEYDALYNNSSKLAKWDENTLVTTIK